MGNRDDDIDAIKYEQHDVHYQGCRIPAVWTRDVLESGVWLGSPMFKADGWEDQGRISRLLLTCAWDASGEGIRDSGAENDPDEEDLRKHEAETDAGEDDLTIDIGPQDENRGEVRHHRHHE